MMGDWTFFSNYGHVLVCLARNHKARLRDVAQDVGITERAVQKIVRDLQDAGFVTVSKQGRCNRYRINRRKALRHALESHVTVGKLLTLVTPATRAVTVMAQAEPPETGEARQEKTSGPVEIDTPAGKQEKQRPVRETSPEPVAAEKRDEGKDKDKSPPDVRQQGSLF